MKQANQIFLRIISALLIMIFLVSMVSCGCDHEYEITNSKAATCAEEGKTTYTCKLCGDSYTETVEKNNTHKYTSTVTKEATVSETGTRKYTCSVCGHSYTETIEKVQSDWTLDYYVDDFGDKGSDAYVRGYFTGTFSNSATAGSKLVVYIYLDKSSNSVEIKLVEYGTHIATFSSSDTITLKTKDASGATKSYSLIYSSGALYSFSSELVSAILNNSTLQFNIVAKSKYSSISDTYNFKVNNAGLKELYNKT